ncbi:conserved hypothetical protein [Ricinus communis]|uniref:Uncharacterized protein n=1 Tax=Ricinus communis TaxID=3988 RepID=B9RJW0_RICCO|nr:conserved hypothetical protein [Ricinus communis]
MGLVSDAVLLMGVTLHQGTKDEGGWLAGRMAVENVARVMLARVFFFRVKKMLCFYPICS